MQTKKTYCIKSETALHDYLLDVMSNLEKQAAEEKIEYLMNYIFENYDMRNLQYYQISNIVDVITQENYLAFDKITNTTFIDNVCE